MTPSRLAAQLRQIAQKIDNSKRPDRRLVAQELRRVLAGMGSGIVVIDGFSNIAYVTSDVRKTLEMIIPGILEKSEYDMMLAGEEIDETNWKEILDSVPDDQLDDIDPDILVVHSHDIGSEGVAVGFSSSDRSSFPMAWPEVLNKPGAFLGNGDPILFKVKGVPENTPIEGIDQSNDPRYLKYQNSR